MVDINLYMIPLCFILLATLLCWLIIGSKGKWFTKSICIFAALYFSVALWTGLASYSGWPTNEKLPEKFVLKSFHIEEPNAIYLVINDFEYNHQSYNFLTYKNLQNNPRMYSIPYDKEMHKQLHKMMKAMQEGRGVAGQKYGDKKNEGKNKGDSLIPQKIIFYELPPAKLPNKK